MNPGYLRFTSETSGYMLAEGRRDVNLDTALIFFRRSFMTRRLLQSNTYNDIRKTAE